MGHRVDIRRYFDAIDHEHLRGMLGQRIRDGVLLRLIGKWLNAGVLEAGSLLYPESGSPQGGVISPILANVFLHEVLDAWFERDVRPRMRGRAHLVRYADDAVMLFENEEDARRVMAVLPQRFGRFGLELHPDKTRLLAFQRPGRKALQRDDESGPDKPGTFDFLGFTLHWAKSPMTGKWIVRTRTAASRFHRTLKRISQWCKAHRHAPLELQQHVLNQKLQGHYGYFGRKGNQVRLWALLHRVARQWWRWLRRRSQRGLNWANMNRLLQRYPLLTPARARPT